MSAAVVCNELAVRHGRLAVLRSISLALAPGEFLAVLGPNGAGKSTLLQALPGLIAFQGTVELLGIPVATCPPGRLCRLRRRVGYVPQLHARSASILPVCVREVVEMGRAGVRGTGRRLTAEDRAVCERIMQQTRLTELADRPYHVLSGGEQRKVHLARALAQEPAVLLLDEPAGHLDFHWQEAITQLIGECWRNSGTTVIMVTHDLRHLPADISRVALLKRGRIIRQGRPQEILQDANLSELYELPLRVAVTEGRYSAFPEEAR